MFIIKPVTDLKSRVISNNLTEDSAEEYDAKKTYAKDDVCKVTSYGTVYKCVSDTAIVDSATNAQVPVLGLFPPSYLVSNTGTYPWMELRVINQLAAFDNYVNTQSASDSGLDYIEYVISVGGCDSVALFNLAAKSVTINVYDNQGSVFYSETIKTYEIVSTLDDYFFTDVSYKDNVVFHFGLGIGGTIKITIKNDGGTAKCGMIVLGKKITLGTTKNEIELPITDYSKYETDSLGRVALSVGLYADMCNFTLYLDEKVSGRKSWDIRKILVGCRGKCTVWCVDNTDRTWETNPSLMICGYYSDISPTERDPGMPSVDVKLTGVV